MITLGIDVGSITTKAAMFKDGNLAGTAIVMTGYNAESAGRAACDRLLADCGVAFSAVERIVATGYGRSRVGFAGRTVTEITCHAAGAHFLNPATLTVIDIGGQDSKAIALAAGGQVQDFVMNDKCAAGTGRFLEVMARALEVDLDAFGALSALAERPSAISSLCTVFAESEVISLISRGESRENIVAGIHESIAVRVAAMVGRVGLRAPVLMTGGVCRNSGVVRALERRLGCEVEVSDRSPEAGAIGAALIAQRLAAGK
jgi:predicted CoA-substrate-specific enzyme activase